MLEDKANRKAASGKKTRSPRRADSRADVFSLESFVGYNLRRAAAKQRERFRSVFDAYDIRPVQLTVLALIHTSGRLKQAALGKALEMKRANVVTVLGELEARGLIARELAEHDRRMHVLCLTPAGKALTKQLIELHDKLEKDLGRSFGQEELSKLIELLRAFRAVDSEPQLE